MFGLGFGDLLHLKLGARVVRLERVLVYLGLLVLIHKELVVLNLGPDLVVYLKLVLALNGVHVVLLQKLLVGQMLSSKYARLL